MSMDTEEMIRAQPIDACVMIGGECSIKSLSIKTETKFMANREEAATRRYPLSSWEESRRTRPYSL
jgi:hypothetical protein